MSLFGFDLARSSSIDRIAGATWLGGHTRSHRNTEV